MRGGITPPFYFEMKSIHNKETIEKLTGLTDLVQLAGDASDRLFYRGKDRLKNSAVIIDYNKPLTAAEPEFQFLRCYGLLKLYEIKIPKIFRVIPEEGLIICQDVGDRTLYTIFKEKLVNDYDLKKIYLNAMNEIIKIKNIPVHRLKKIKAPIFSEEKFEWETEFFLKYYLDKHLHKKLNQSENKLLSNFFTDLNEKVYATVNVSIHRDFHSRNLLYFKSKVFSVDYQDLRIGPEHYDIASLLWDSYVDLPEDLRDYLVRHYIDFSGKEYDTDFEIILYTAIQRNIKAIATFCYLSYKKGKKEYLNNIPLTLKHIKENFKLLNLDINVLNLLTLR